MEYRGYEVIRSDDERLAEFYKAKANIFNLLENQYLLVEDLHGKLADSYVWQNGTFRKLTHRTIKSEYCGIIKPRNIYQELALDMLQTRNATIKVFRGTYGCGKDFLMSAEAFSQIEKDNFNKIVYIRPNVNLANVPDIGFLKGDLNDKLGWTLAPLWDKLGGQEAVENLQAKGIIELVPLPFIRGRSFENSIVYVSEGQNITKEIAALIVSRLGENSELWINGDCHQTDKRVYDENNGITAMIQSLKGDSLFQTVYSPITERSKTAQLAAKIMGE